MQWNNTYQYKEILLSDEYEWTIDTGYDVHKFQMHYTEKKPDTKVYLLYDPIYIKC